MTIDNENKKAEGKEELAAAFRSISVELYNKEHNAAKALDSIGKACELDPGNSLYLYERDCLLEEVGSDPVVRLSLLEGKDDLIAERDELSLNYAHVLNLNSRIDEAMDIILGRDFSLDEVGQIRLAEEYKRTMLSMAARETEEGNPDRALVICELSFTYPKNLHIGESVKVPDNMGYLMIGDILKDKGDGEAAEAAYLKAAEGEKEPRLLLKDTDIPSDCIYWQALALGRLGRKKEALEILRRLIDFGNDNMNREADEEEIKKNENEKERYKKDPRKRDEEYLRRLTALGVRGLGEV